MCCRLSSAQFRGDASGYFPNADSGYLNTRVYNASNSTVLVTRVLLPRAPLGTTPVPWPNNKRYDLRYWSICNNINVAPFPVVINTDP